MSEDCRSADCCPGSDFPRFNAGPLDESYHSDCGTGPTVTIAASSLVTWCDEPITISWTSQDVSVGGTVTISPDIGVVPANQAGSQDVDLIDTATYTITATDICGNTATASVTITKGVGVALCDVSAHAVNCGDTITIHYSTSVGGGLIGAWLYIQNIDMGMTSTVILTPNTSGNYTLVVQGNLQITVEALSGCGSVTDWELITVAAEATGNTITATQEGACGLRIEWNLTSICAQLQQWLWWIEGPGFTGVEEVNWTGTRDVDLAGATYYPLNGSGKLEWTWTLFDAQGGIAASGTLEYCPPPILLKFEISSDTLVCPTNDSEVCWVTRYAQAGIVIYDHHCNVFYSDATAQPENMQACTPANMKFYEATTLYLYAIEACGKAACNGPLCDYVGYTDCACQICEADVPDFHDVVPPYVHLVENIGACAEETAELQDCTCVGVGDWGQKFQLHGTSCYYYPVDSVGVPTLGKIAGTTEICASVVHLEYYADSEECYWKLNIYCTTTEWVMYRLDTFSPIGTYYKFNDNSGNVTNQWLDTLTIAPANFNTVPPGAPTCDPNSCTPI